MQYLYKRKDSKTGKELDNWQLRVPIPKALQSKPLTDPHTGKLLANSNGGPVRLYRKSIGTSDRKAAEKIARPIVNNLKMQFDSLEVAQGHIDLGQVAVDTFYRPVMNDLTSKLANVAKGGEANELARRQAQIMRLSRELQTGEASVFEQSVEKVIATLGLGITKDSAEYQQFVEYAHKFTIEALHVFAAGLQGDFDAEPRDAVLRDALAGKSAKAAKGETIAELFKQYGEIRVEEGRKRADGIAQDSMVIDRFAEYVGRNRAVASITVEDARGFRDTIAKLPSGYSKRRDYAGLDIHQAVAKGERDGTKRISMVTRQRYMSTVSPFFDWLRSEGRIAIQPFDGLHQRVVKGENPRPTFTSAQLNVILASPLFTGFIADGKEHIAGNMHANDWRYWIPLIGLFTGARITEIAQLNVDNIVKISVQSEEAEANNQVYFFEFKHDKNTGQKTKSGKRRIVPVHSRLVALGFLTYLKRQVVRSIADGNRQLFPELKLTGERGKLGDLPSRFWRDYLSAIAIKSGADGMGAHSFRHTISDRLRTAGYLDREFGPLILGHSDKSVTGGYGELKQGTARMRHEMLEAVKFDDLDFSYLHTARV